MYKENNQLDLKFDSYLEYKFNLIKIQLMKQITSVVLNIHLSKKY